jgi:NDP-sugar pyrophosphorylase family protein
MKAMILCAGYGTRLGDLTRETPKPLLRVGGHALVDFILANLKKHGFSEVMVNVHHHADQVRAGLGHWAHRGVSIDYSFEETLLGTAGALKKVESFFADEEVFLVHYGDIVTDLDLTKMLQFHRERRATATLLVHKRQRSNSAVEFDGNQCIHQFVERPPESFWDKIHSAWVNSGVLLLTPRVFEVIPDEAPSDWPRDIFPKLISSQSLFAYCLDSYRIAVDSPERLAQLESDLDAQIFTFENFRLEPKSPLSRTD